MIDEKPVGNTTLIRFFHHSTNFLYLKESNVKRVMSSSHQARAAEVDKTAMDIPGNEAGIRENEVVPAG